MRIHFHFSGMAWNSKPHCKNVRSAVAAALSTSLLSPHSQARPSTPCPSSIYLRHQSSRARLIKGRTASAQRAHPSPATSSTHHPRQRFPRKKTRHPAPRFSNPSPPPASPHLLQPPAKPWWRDSESPLRLAAGADLDNVARSASEAICSLAGFGSLFCAGGKRGLDDRGRGGQTLGKGISHETAEGIFKFTRFSVSPARTRDHSSPTAPLPHCQERSPAIAEASSIARKLPLCSTVYSRRGESKLASAVRYAI